MRRLTFRTETVYPKSFGEELELAENEFIFDKCWNGDYEAEVVIAEETHFCGAETSDGSPCENEVGGVDEVCHMHE